MSQLILGWKPKVLGWIPKVLGYPAKTLAIDQPEIGSGYPLENPASGLATQGSGLPCENPAMYQPEIGSGYPLENPASGLATQGSGLPCENPPVSYQSESSNLPGIPSILDLLYRFGVGGGPAPVHQPHEWDSSMGAMQFTASGLIEPDGFNFDLMSRTISVGQTYQGYNPGSQEPRKITHQSMQGKLPNFKLV